MYTDQRKWVNEFVHLYLKAQIISLLCDVCRKLYFQISKLSKVSSWSILELLGSASALIFFTSTLPLLCLLRLKQKIRSKLSCYRNCCFCLLLYSLLCSSLLWKWTIGKVFHYRYIQNLRIGLFVKGPLQQYCQLCLISCPTMNWGSLSKWSLGVVKFQLLLNLFLIQFPKIVAFYLRLSFFFIYQSRL